MGDSLILMKASHSKKIVTFIVGILMALATYWYNHSDLGLASDDPSSVGSATGTVPVATVSSSTAIASSTQIQTNAVVTHVADGDTITVRIDGEKDDVKIRMLGVNTPESVDPRRPVECFGKEASNFTKEQLSNKRVFLKEDPEADNVDKYGRYLREIILDDGRNYNELLIASGYAYAYTSFPESRDRKATFNRLQAEAKAQQVGLWNPETCNGVK